MRISTEAPAVPASEASLKLQVTAAYPRDTGRGLARLGPAAFAALGLEAGDIVEVAGRRATVCRASPSEDEPGVQLDEISRQNAGVEVSETARLRHVRPADGESVVLRPARGAEEIPEPEILRQILDGHPVRTGDLLRAILPDTRGVDLEVVETAPEMPCRIVRTTRITLVSGVVDRPEIAATPDVSYADVGGLAAQLARVREIVELPLRLPEVFERLGIDPPKGVLLHGPPGCGKTLIARAAAHEIRASFFSVQEEAAS